MRKMERRPFLGAAIAGFPYALLGQSPGTPMSSRIPPVLSGDDRLGEHHTIGVSSTNFKVLTRDTGGGLFVMEHTHRKKGGPPRHLHHTEDEWFFPLEGQYIVEVGSERYEVKAGDSILAPKGTPHAWAFVGDTPGRMIIAFAPAGKMEAFFRDAEKGASASAYSNDPEVFRKYGLELVGPPIKVG